MHRPIIASPPRQPKAMPTTADVANPLLSFEVVGSGVLVLVGTTVMVLMTPSTVATDGVVVTVVDVAVEEDCSSSALIASTVGPHSVSLLSFLPLTLNLTRPLSDPTPSPGSLMCN